MALHLGRRAPTWTPADPGVGQLDLLGDEHPSTGHDPSARSARLAAVVLAAVLGNYRQTSHRGTVVDARRVERAVHTVDPGSVLLTDDYHDGQYLLYYLVGEGFAERRDLAAAVVSPADVERYLGHGTGPVADAAGRIHGHRDPPLYAATARQAHAGAARGVEVTTVAQDLWRLTPSTRP